MITIIDKSFNINQKVDTSERFELIKKSSIRGKVLLEVQEI